MLCELWARARPRGWFEYVAIVLTCLAIAYWLHVQGWSWKAVASVPLLLVFGYMAGSMVYDLWAPRR